jgi:hypothetical protein
MVQQKSSQSCNKNATKFHPFLIHNSTLTCAYKYVRAWNIDIEIDIEKEKKEKVRAS